MERKQTIREKIFYKVEEIIPGIKSSPLFEPSKSRELYKPIRSADAASNISQELRENPKLQEFFKPFTGQVVVDIGPGGYLSGYQVALFSKARAYVGVEPYGFIEDLKKFLSHAKEMLGGSSPQIPRTAVQADALSFLKRLPDKSVSIFASQMESVMSQEYSATVVKEIQRVLHPQGALIEYDSTFNLDKNLFTYYFFDREPEDSTLLWELERYQLKT